MSIGVSVFMAGLSCAVTVTGNFMLPLSGSSASRQDCGMSIDVRRLECSLHQSSSLSHNSKPPQQQSNDKHNNTKNQHKIAA